MDIHKNSVLIKEDKLRDWAEPTPFPQKEINALRDTYLTGFRLFRYGDIGEENLEQIKVDLIEAVARVTAAWVAENYEDGPWYDGEGYGNDLQEIVDEVIQDDFDEIDPDFELCPLLTEATVDLLTHSPCNNCGDDEGYSMSDVVLPMFGQDEGYNSDDAFADWPIG